MRHGGHQQAAAVDEWCAGKLVAYLGRTRFAPLTDPQSSTLRRPENATAMPERLRMRHVTVGKRSPVHGLNPGFAQRNPSFSASRFWLAAASSTPGEYRSLLVRVGSWTSAFDRRKRIIGEAPTSGKDTLSSRWAGIRFVPFPGVLTQSSENSSEPVVQPHSHAAAPGRQQAVLGLLLRVRRTLEEEDVARVGQRRAAVGALGIPTLDGRIVYSNHGLSLQS